MNIKKMEAEIKRQITDSIDSYLSSLSFQQKFAVSSANHNYIPKNISEPVSLGFGMHVDSLVYDELDIENRFFNVFSGTWSGRLRFMMYSELYKKEMPGDVGEIRGGYSECRYQWSYDQTTSELNVLSKTEAKVTSVIVNNIEVRI